VLVNIDVPVINPKSSAGLIPCEVGEEACSNGVDDDLDGFVDCDDPDCRVLAMCNRPPSTADAATSDALMCDVQPDGDDATVSQASCP
jgi:hypothetical protein